MAVAVADVFDEDGGEVGGGVVAVRVVKGWGSCTTGRRVGRR